MQFSEDWVLITFSWILLPDLDKNKQTNKNIQSILKLKREQVIYLHLQPLQSF